MSGRNSAPKKDGGKSNPSRIDQYSEQHQPFLGHIPKKNECNR
ncbi:hypothetical protein [Marinicrinis sediminis]|uniref:Uncharacterized protein n=1 Tax=Marinicrinis sediminis TaxID=1652465 RepID=A0ABW5REE6_9BACL